MWVFLGVITPVLADYDCLSENIGTIGTGYDLLPALLTSTIIDVTSAKTGGCFLILPLVGDSLINNNVLQATKRSDACGAMLICTDRN